MKKLILIGAGLYCLKALEKYGKERVAFICDNNVTKQGTQIKGISIYPVESLKNIYNNEQHVIMITIDKSGMVEGQLKLLGINTFLHFQSQENILSNRDNDEIKYADKNKVLDYYVEETKKCNLLKSTEYFTRLSAEIMRKHDEEKLELYRYGYREEGHLYGNIDCLIKYACCEKFDLRYLPNMSHNGVVPLYSTSVMYKNAVIVGGDYYRYKIHKHYPYVPVFSVGPYIQYVEGIYSENQINDMKMKNGKTALIFLPHSIEDISRKYGKKKFIDDVLEHYKDKYDKFILCVYWADICNEISSYAQNKKLQVVSAGFRFDPLFNRRLKSILQLSDAVIGGDWGTHYVYALCMNKPVARINITNNETISDSEFQEEYEKKLQFTEEYKYFCDEFYEAITSEIKISDRQKMWCNPYAGLDYKRTPEYIKNIFDISKDILSDCGGEQFRYANAVRNVYNRYWNDGEFEKMEILKEATGTYLN